MEIIQAQYNNHNDHKVVAGSVTTWRYWWTAYHSPSESKPSRYVQQGHATLTSRISSWWNLFFFVCVFIMDHPKTKRWMIWIFHAEGKWVASRISSEEWRMPDSLCSCERRGSGDTEHGLWPHQCQLLPKSSFVLHKCSIIIQKSHPDVVRVI